eukprot:CAMPEP_0203752584 /NCGR_PEP_ID=MMETSP0098-20131031/6488_1 /ASSEMBLY_ACC=CAM_ASM_000208 /TAXON_ID=96639 /ORGANISM=" , Strain NY0313808BC1" /LENGTH=532 /DNA_ID=CAMNT_0050642813 /DNA_START=229 /DNA_END=1824 /DNA_ORIENTATION=+
MLRLLVCLAAVWGSLGRRAKVPDEGGAPGNTDLFGDADSHVVEVGEGFMKRAAGRIKPGDTLYLVNFYSGSCGHCQTHADTWKKAAKFAANGGCKTQLLAVNCDSWRDLCTIYEVESTPRIYGFGIGGNVGEPKTGTLVGEEFGNIVRWIEEADKSFNLEDALEMEDEYVEGDDAGSEAAPRKEVVNDIHNMDAKAMLKVDISSALRFGLETGVFLGKTYLDGEALDALYSWINLLRQSFPGDLERKQLHWFLSKLKALETKSGSKKRISSKEFDGLLKQWKFASSKMSSVGNGTWRATWILCRQRSIRDIGVYGGYPCALWALFHVLSVSSSSGGAPPEQTLSAIAGYIRHFFSCSECVQNFVKSNPDPLHDVLLKAEKLGVSKSRALILFFWMEHNAVTRRLIREFSGVKRKRKKVIARHVFPVRSRCRSCYRDSSSKLRGVAPAGGDFEYLSNNKGMGPNAKFRDTIATSTKGVAKDPNVETDIEWDYDVLLRFLKHTYCFVDSRLKCPSGQAVGRVGASSYDYDVSSW